jgi:hypothetical protein
MNSLTLKVIPSSNFIISNMNTAAVRTYEVLLNVGSRHLFMVIDFRKVSKIVYWEAGMAVVGSFSVTIPDETV